MGIEYLRDGIIGVKVLTKELELALIADRTIITFVTQVRWISSLGAAEMHP